MKETVNKVVVAFSGGMDSTVLLHMAAKKGYREIFTLSFDYGQRHHRELKCVQEQKELVKEAYPTTRVYNKVLNVGYVKDIAYESSLTNLDIDNPDISQMAGDAQPTSYVPFRNLMFLAACCAYAESVGADVVWYGATGVDSMAGYWDADKYFIEQVNKLVALNRKHSIQIVAPLIDYDKADIVREGVDLGVDFGKTWTCYSNHADGLADATTPSSSLRVRGFIEAGYRDPIKYVQQEQLDQMYNDAECSELLAE